MANDTTTDLMDDEHRAEMRELIANDEVFWDEQMTAALDLIDAQEQRIAELEASLAEQMRNTTAYAERVRELESSLNTLRTTARAAAKSNVHGDWWRACVEIGGGDEGGQDDE